MLRRALIALAFSAAALCFARAAVAAEVDVRTARVRQLEQQRGRAEAERRAKDAELQQMTAAVARLKAARPSWNRDRNLEQKLADSKDVASRLDLLQRQLRELDAKLVAERKGLLEAITREASAQPPPGAPRLAQLARLRAEAEAQLPRQARRVKAVDARIDPLDEPEDLDAKAADLAQSERQMRDEVARLDRRVEFYARLAKLERSRSRSQEVDVFRDDQPRRHTGSARPVAVSSAAAEGDRDDGPTTPGGPAADGSSLDGNYDSPTGNGGVPSVETTIDLAVILGDVVEPGTLDELRRAERSGDPEAKVRAAQRARADLRARAERLRARRLEMEQRARELRTPK